MNADKGRVWLITGCSSGLGRALAEAALARGERVVLTARKPESLAGIAAAFPETSLALPLDVNDGAQITAALAAAEKRFGPIDVLVNNAGYMQLGAVEEASDEEYRGHVRNQLLRSVPAYPRGNWLRWAQISTPARKSPRRCSTTKPTLRPRREAVW